VVPHTDAKAPNAVGRRFALSILQKPPRNKHHHVISSFPRGGGGGSPLKQSNSLMIKKTKSTTKAAIRSKSSKKPSTTTGKASITTSVFNLANNVAGAGILTLAAGKATGTGWIPSIVTCVTLAFISAHTFRLIGKACDLTGHNTFKALWGEAFGPKTAWIVDSMVFTQCFFVSIIYTGLLGDIFSALLANIKSMALSRTQIIVGAALTVLWPLNMIRDLSALGFTSILGLVAVLYTVFFMVVRALDGSYSVGLVNVGGEQGLGRFAKEAPYMPNFAKSTMWNIDMNSLVLMSNLGLAFIAHYNGRTYF